MKSIEDKRQLLPWEVKARRAPTFGNRTLIERAEVEIDLALHRAGQLLPLYVSDLESVGEIPDETDWEGRFELAGEYLRRAYAWFVVLFHRKDFSTGQWDEFSADLYELRSTRHGLAKHEFLAWDNVDLEEDKRLFAIDERQRLMWRGAYADLREFQFMFASGDRLGDEVEYAPTRRPTYRTERYLENTKEGGAQQDGGGPAPCCVSLRT